MLRRSPRLVWIFCTVLSLLLLSACSTQRPTRLGLATNPDATWSGKLNLTLETEPKQSFSAEFDLQGDALNGAMQFYTSLGTTLAYAQWNATGAELLSSSGESLHFTSIEALSQKYMGATLPVDLIFAWANGEPVRAPQGWSIVKASAQSSSQVDGAMNELMATREFPLPRVQLRLWLKKASD